MWQLYLLLFIQVFLGIIIAILLHKVGKLKAQVDEITREVKDYISFIIEDEASAEADTPKVLNDIKSGEAMQSSLIQSVLGDFFP
jgi:hypothetical protein